MGDAINSIGGVLGIIVSGLSLASTMISVGIIVGKINKHDEAFKELRDDIDSIRENYVDMVHFNAVVRPLQEQVKEIHSDIKKILVILSSSERNSKKNKGFVS